MTSNLTQVQTLFAELTRYPLEILDPDADLEEELGIDSVKQMEILSTFKDRFGLPEDFEVNPEAMRTIGDVAKLLDEAGSGDSQGNGRSKGLNGHGHHPGTNGSPATVTTPPLPKSGHKDLATQVVDTLERVTRYPREILTLDADLEEDLGIDSVKMAEALSLLGEELGLPPDTRPEGETIRTIGDVVTALEGVLHKNQGPAPSHKAPSVEALSNGRVGTINGVQAGLTPLLMGSAKPFAGKIALITGSGHGIGRAIAEEVAGLGAHVIINSFHSRDRGEATRDHILKSGGKASHIWGSVANITQLHRIFDEIEAEHGGLDFFISNASNGMLGPLATIQPEHWDRAFRTNILGLHQGALRAAKLMAPRGGGKIITISSPGAQRYIEHFGCMGPIKAAVESLTKYLAIELAPQNIQCNSVSAGPIYGELLDKYPEAERLIPYWESLSAGQRLGEAKDVSNFVAYLLSPASNKISGSVLLVDNAGSQRI